MTKKRQKPEQGIVERLMGEMVLCGGLLYTRKQLFDELLAEGFPYHYVDAFVFGYLKTVEVTPELLKQDHAIRRAVEAENTTAETLILSGHDTTKT